jgi:hypothetical protein
MYPWLATLLVEEALRREDLSAASEWLSPCLPQNHTSAKGWWWPELLRLNGVLTAKQSAQPTLSGAGACLQEAIEVARQQGALMLELRAVMSLVAHDRGRRPHAVLKQELEQVTSRFQSEEESPDATAARRLSAELGQ